MSRIDRRRIRQTVAAVLCLALAFGPVQLSIGTVSAGAAEDTFRPDNEDLYFGALTEELKDNTVKATVRKGTFSINAGYKGSLDHDNIKYVTNTVNVGTVTFSEQLVTQGRTVRKGDHMIKVRVSTENVDLGQLKEDIEAKTDNLESFIVTNNELLSEYRNVMDNGATPEERRMAELLYDRLEVSFKQERTKRESEIETLSNRYSSYLLVREAQYIDAPCDGVITYLARFRSGETIGTNAFIAVVVGKGTPSVTVSGGTEPLRYGQKVTITQNGSELELEGIVTACNSSLLSPNLIGNAARIEITGGDVSLLDLNSDVIVRTSTVVMEDALILPRSAVGTDGKGSFVYLNRDGHSSKRYVVVGGVNSEEAWIVHGLSEGDTVVIK